MNAVIASSKYATDARYATGSGEISFEKIGTFTREQFLQQCMTVASIHIECFYVDIHCTDNDSLEEGLSRYRELRPHTKIVIIALQRSSADATVVSLARAGFEIHSTPAEADRQIESGEEDEGRLSGAINRLTTALNQQVQLDSPDALLMDLPDLPVQERVVIQQKIIGSVVIAVIGVEPSVGCTHQSILIANYLTRLGKSVALVEANNSGHYAVIERLYEGVNGFVSQSRTFEINRTDYYKVMKPSELTSLFSEKYDYIVLDIGYHQESDWVEEFARADVQLVIGAGIEWRQEANRAFALTYKKLDQSRWVYGIPMTEQLNVADIKKLLQQNAVYRIPYHSDPYKKQKDTDAALEEILNRYIGEKKKATPKGLLYGAIVICIAVIILLITLLILK